MTANALPYRAGARLDLAPLYRHCLFSSQERQDSHHRVAQEFSDHNLTWRGGEVDTVMYRARAHALSVVMLRYGAEIDITPRPFEDFALIHMTLQGVAHIESDGERVALPPGRSALLAPRKDLRMHWQQGAEQLILKIPTALLQHNPQAEAAHCAQPLPALSLLSPAHEQQWAALVQSLIVAASMPMEPSGIDGRSSPAPWVQGLERSIAGYVLAVHGHATPPVPEAPAAQGIEFTSDGVPLSQRRLQAMERYVQARLGAPLGLEDLAQAVGVGERTLHGLCLKHYGVSPMERVRQMRLDAVRNHLLSHARTSVTDAAMLYGFGHLGRFAAYYRERFGESPSQTCRPTVAPACA